MPRFYSALELRWPARPADDHLERVLAELDQEQPFAIDEIVNGVRVFLPSADACTRAALLVQAIDHAVSTTIVDVSDEDWAERSQSSLAPIRVGRFVVSPDGSGEKTPDVLFLTIKPSMGFGTGHHASTRLCLRLLQAAPVAGASVLDVGTGSGILAIAARKLGATDVVATDVDPDALASASENLALNHEPSVLLHQGELAAARKQLGRAFDVVLANLTGALLMREAASLAGLTRPGGQLIASGFQQHEIEHVTASFRAAGLIVGERLDEDDWVGVRSSLTTPKHSTAR